MSSSRYGYQLTLFFMVFIAMTVLCPRPLVADVCSDGIAFPPFVSRGLDANLLMIIDNSESMYDLAYVPEFAAQQGYCYDDTYDNDTTYAGYFDSDTVQWYIYNPVTEQFEADDYTNVNTQFHAAMTAGGILYRGGSSSDRYARVVLKESVNPHEVMFFAATGNFLNWAAASKFDVEKKVLTGGKYDSGQMIMESRGCMNKTFVKKAEVIKDTDSSTNYLTLGIISESDATSTHLTRIEIFDVTPNGFQAADCQEAIDEFSDPDGGSLGTVKSYTTDCLDPLGTGLVASQTAFNHIMQECWYFNAHGVWQPGAGTINSLKNDCEKVYAGDYATGNPPFTVGAANEANYLANYAPEAQSPTDVCYGRYGTSAGYVGRCWEATYSTGGVTCDPTPCTPGTDSPTEALVDPGHDDHSASRFCNSGTSTWYYCNGSYNATHGSCNGSPGEWTEEETCVPAAGGVLQSVDWTDDTNGTYIESGLFTDADDCADQSLQKWCANLDDPGVVDPTDSMSSSGTTYNVPAILVESAVDSQLGTPLLTMKGLIEQGSTPTGLLHEYQGQIRMGAMAFNDGPKSECAPVEQPAGSGRYVANLYDCLLDKGTAINASSTADTTKRDGAHIISYIGKGTSHTTQLVSAINDIEATTWTPTAEAYYDALGYYTQNASRRLYIDDFLANSDYGGTLPATILPDADPSNPNTIPLWTRNTVYPASDWTTDPATVTIVRDASNNLYWTDDGGTSSEYLADGTTLATEIGDDTDVVWMPFDPVQARCQKNNVLILTDGASTADQDTAVVTLAATIVDPDESVADSPYACGSLSGSTLLDDLTYFGFNGSIYPTARFTDENGNPATGDNVRTYLVSTGTLRDVTAGLPAECDSETLLDSAAANGYDRDPATGNPLGELFQAEDPSELGYKLRAVFNDIRAGRASGSAASVISSSRSGEGAIYQALFFTSQVDADMREINWAGDVHSLWLDRYGNIREDCGPATCATPCDPTTCPADQALDLQADNIITFYTDSTAGGTAMARRYSDADGDGSYNAMGCSDSQYTTEDDCTAGGGTWDYSYSPDLVEGGIDLQDIKYIWSAGEWLAAAEPGQKTNYSDVPAAGDPARYIFTWLPDTGDIVPFTTAGMAAALTANEYLGYLQAADATEANAIVNFIRGEDQTGYRSRLIDWDGDGTPEIYKLGDIVDSTPTIVSRPAEDYDVIYGDDSYRAFRKQYENRRTMVYAGGNDGGMHAFNGGYYDRNTNQFYKAPPVAGSDPVTYETQYDLGSEMWMFIPNNLLPHLKCLADENYDIGSHKYYVDQKPKIFDAKIFDPDDGIHTGGWGTILVGGMRFGGSDVGVDTNGDSVDDETLRSAFFILDITNPECPPVVLAEFTHADLGFTTSYPTAIPMLDCTRGVDCPADQSVTTWPMTWYLAFGSGPHDAADPQTALEGRSDQKAKLFVLKLGGTDPADYVYTTTPQVTPSGSCPSLFTYNRPSLETGYPKEIAPMCSDPTYTDDAPVTGCTAHGNTWENFSNSFLGDMITVDFDLSFQADALYFGSTADTDLPLDDHTGGLHRFVISNVDNPATWDFSTMLNLGQPVSAAPAAAYDGRNYWLYFGTGRFFTRDDKSTTAQQSFYGVKEQDRSGAFDLSAPNDGDLVDVSNVGVYAGGALSALPFSTGGRITTAPITPATIPINVATFAALKNAMIGFDGWKIDFDLPGERNLGQAAVLGDIVTFTTYVPSADVCTAEGDSYLWAPYYKTGTSYFQSVIGQQYDAGAGQFKVLRKISLGSGMSTTPNIHSGAGEGTKAFVQTSTGAIIGIEQANPGVIKSGPASWRELLGN
jgi:Tfp pilus tip-associated adhesin PilY1